MNTWCCGCGVHGNGLDDFVKHIEDNPNTNHREHCEKKTTNRILLEKTIEVRNFLDGFQDSLSDGKGMFDTAFIFGQWHSTLVKHIIELEELLWKIEK